MIYLLAAMSVTLLLAPLLILGCIRRGSEKPEKTVLPFSNMETTAPPHVTSPPRDATCTPPPPPPAAPVATPPPPLPPQPKSDGAKDTGGTSTSKSKPPGLGESDNTTDKQREQPTASMGSTEKLEKLAPPRSFHSYMQRRSRSRVSMEKSAHKREKNAHHKRDQNPEPSGSKKKSSPLTGTREPMRRTARTPNKRMVTPPPGSKKSKKSRKALLPKSPSWKEIAARTRATPTAGSKTDVTAQAKTPIPEGYDNSMRTAISEASFRENKHKVLGHVDRIIAASDEGEVLHAALATDQEVTCVDPTNPARSPYFYGEFSVWVADRVGSQAEG